MSTIPSESLVRLNKHWTNMLLWCLFACFIIIIFIVTITMIANVSSKTKVESVKTLMKEIEVPQASKVIESVQKPSASITAVSSEAELNEILQKYPNAVVLFSATWCGFCNQIRPAFEQAAKQSALQFINADCTQAKDMAKKYSIEGYPTILKFKNGKNIDMYKGNRQVDTIRSFAGS